MAAADDDDDQNAIVLHYYLTLGSHPPEEEGGIWIEKGRIAHEQEHPLPQAQKASRPARPPTTRIAETWGMDGGGQMTDALIATVLHLRLVRA